MKARIKERMDAYRRKKYETPVSEWLRVKGPPEWLKWFCTVISLVALFVSIFLAFCR